MRHAVVLFLVALLDCLPVMATPFEDLRAKAQRGDAKAQYALGNAYYDGKGAP